MERDHWNNGVHDSRRCASRICWRILKYGRHHALARSYLLRSAGRLVLRVFGGAVLFRGADLTLVWRPLFAMLVIGSVYFAIA